MAQITYIPMPQEEPKKAHDSIGEKAKAALYLWFFLACALGILAVLVPGKWEGYALLARLAMPPAVAGLIACIAGAILVYTAAVRPWTQEDKVLKRQWSLEDEDRKRQLRLLEAAERQVVEGDDLDGDPATLTDEQQLDLLAVRILERYYIDGQSVTRDACTAAGLCGQPQWNEVNTLLKARGIKKGNTMDDTLDFGAAWLLWRTGKKGNHSWVVKDRQMRPKT